MQISVYPRYKYEGRPVKNVQQKISILLYLLYSFLIKHKMYFSNYNQTTELNSKRNPMKINADKKKFKSLKKKVLSHVGFICKSMYDFTHVIVFYIVRSFTFNSKDFIPN